MWLSILNVIICTIYNFLLWFENGFLQVKGNLHYKTINSQNVS